MPEFANAFPVRRTDVDSFGSVEREPRVFTVVEGDADRESLWGRYRWLVLDDTGEEVVGAATLLIAVEDAKWLTYFSTVQWEAR